MTKPLAYLDEMPRNILPQRKIKVYFASRLTHSARARKLQVDWPEFEWVSRWPTLHVGKVPEDPIFCRVFWEHDLEDVGKSDVVLAYGESTDILRGALVECGMGIALGKQVVVVGECESYGTWQYHPLVHRVPSLQVARAVLRVIAL